VEQRIAWDDLPGPLKQAIEARTGPITGVRIASAGQNSPLAAIIDARDGKVFAKGLPSGHRRVITQAREAAVAPLVKEISPALLWHFDEAGGTFSATSTRLAATPTTPRAHLTSSGWCSSWTR
jgi:hypothetical protein